jgi:hypothetical protein
MAASDSSEKGRIRLFWMLSSFATFLFLSSSAFLMTVPGNDPRTDSLLPSFAALLLTVALFTGTKRVQEAEPPISVWPGPIIVVILALQLAVAIAQAIVEIRRY